MNNPRAQHAVDNDSGRHSGLIPIQENSRINRSDDYYETYVDLAFGCLNTCMGMEYSLRIWNLIFTLETE